MCNFITVLFLYFTLCFNAFGETESAAFEVVKSGKGNKSIMFIPGFASSGEVWDETKAIFEKEYTCYTLTMAGFAGSKPQQDPSFKNWVKSIATYIKENKIEKPIIVGHSMGGGLALAIASDYPELIEKIVVVDALPSLSALINPFFQSTEKTACSAILNQITSLTKDQFCQMQKMAISRLVADTSKQDLVLSWSMNSDRETFAKMYCDFSNTDLREKIGNIKCPVLILLEEPFKNMKPAIEEQYKKLKNANIQYADKGLHFIMYDDKDWYLEQLSKFVAIY